MQEAFSRHLTGRERSRTTDVRLGVILAFVAGAINAAGFLAVSYYTSHMTGIISAIGDSLAIHNHHAALFALFYVIIFATGAATTAVLINWARQKKLHSEYALCLMIEALLLLLFGLFAFTMGDNAGFSAHAVITLLCFIMGLQNAIITKISRAEIRTTHMTGLVTDIGIEIGRFFYSRFSKGSGIAVNRERLGLHSQLLLSFTIGAIAGAFLFKEAGFIMTIPFAIILGVISAGPIMDDVKGKNGAR